MLVVVRAYSQRVVIILIINKDSCPASLILFKMIEIYSHEWNIA